MVYGLGTLSVWPLAFKGVTRCFKPNPPNVPQSLLNNILGDRVVQYKPSRNVSKRSCELNAPQALCDLTCLQPVSLEHGHSLQILTPKLINSAQVQPGSINLSALSAATRVVGAGCSFLLIDSVQPNRRLFSVDNERGSPQTGLGSSTTAFQLQPC